MFLFREKGMIMSGGAHERVDGQAWIERLVREAKSKKEYRKGESLSFTIETGIFVVFDDYVVIPPAVSAAGTRTPKKIVKRGKEPLFLKPGTKVTIWDLSRKNARQHGIIVASFEYDDGHVVSYKYGEKLSRKTPRR